MKNDLPPELNLSTEVAEQSIISIVLSYPYALDGLDLKPEHFSADYLRVIFAELMRQVSDGKGASVSTLHDKLWQTCTLEELNAIATCHDYSARPIKRLVEQVVDGYRSRQLQILSQRIGLLAFEQTPVADRIDQAQAEIAKLVTVEDSDEWVDAHTGAMRHSELIEQREAGNFSGIETGLIDFDEMLDGGLQRGNLVVIGARPSMGKTAMALTVGLHIARRFDVGFMSMEMSVSDVMDRQAAILGGTSISFIKRPKKGLDYGKIVDGIELAKTLKFRVSDRSGLNILQLRAKARALKRRFGLDVLIVDYIGLMSGTDSRTPRAYQIEEISRGLKGLAKELDMVVVCLAQVNRGASERPNQIPGLSDLRDSGAIEQDADVVGFIHRPIMANPQLPHDFNSYALLRVAKNRQGRCGDIHLHYMAEQTRFSAWCGEPPQIQSVNKERGL